MSVPARSREAGRAGRALRALAQDAGIQLAYDDATGQRRVASTEALLAVLRALGLAVERPDDAEQAHADLRADRCRRIIPHNTVAWNGRTIRMPMHTDRSFTREDLAASIVPADGGDAIDLSPVDITDSTSSTGRDVRWRPARTIPFGMHDLAVRLGGREVHAHLISAPLRCFEPGQAACSVGTFLPLYALHSLESLAVGDLTDLAALSECMIDHGAAYIGTLPLLACFLDDHFNASPYAPVSRLFWNELYVDIRRAPEFERSAEAQQRLNSDETRRAIDKARAQRLVDYRRAARLKHALIDDLADRAFACPESRARLDAFMNSAPGVRQYANYRAAVHEFGSTWQSWTAAQKRKVHDDGWSDSPHWRRHLYGQWLFTEQLDSLIRELSNRSAGLYLDLPVGANDDGFDRWRFHDQFAEGMDVGAPPDPFFTRGQNWGFSPLHPEHSSAQGHAYFAATLDAHCRFASMLRIDHVMALHRLFWIPRGMNATQGVYVRYPRDELYAILSLASHRHRCRIVGENLGTVPRSVTQYMKRHGVLSMSVAQFEMGETEVDAMPRPGDHTLAAMNTHDMPPFAAYWQGDDIDTRVEHGLLTDETAEQERARRDRIRRAVARWLQRHGTAIDEDDAPAALRAIMFALARSDASVLMINLEDLWLEPDPQNVPGIPEDIYPSWRRKSARSLEDMCSDSALADLLDQICRARTAVAAERRSAGEE